jgi:hypothetical protein
VGQPRFTAFYASVKGGEKAVLRETNKEKKKVRAGSSSMKTSTSASLTFKGTLSCEIANLNLAIGRSARHQVSTMKNVPSDLRDFILRHIDSVAQLEALLLLRQHPDHDWTVEELAGRLYIAPDQAMPLLRQIKEAGFIETVDDKCRYTGGSIEQKETIDKLAEFYSSHLVIVTNLIHSKPRRIREFADAFRLKKD